MLLLFVLRFVPVGHGQDAVRVVEAALAIRRLSRTTCFRGTWCRRCGMRVGRLLLRGGRMSWTSRVVGGEGKREGGR